MDACPCLHREGKRTNFICQGDRLMITVVFNVIMIWFWAADTSAGSVACNCGMKTLTNDTWNTMIACINHVCPTYNMCSHHSLLLLPSGSCSETNSHRCGHIRQQHRACVIHRYGELKCFPLVTHTHTHTFVHCLTLASSYMNVAVPHAAFGGHAGRHSCSCAEDRQDRQV